MMDKLVKILQRGCSSQTTGNLTLNLNYSLERSNFSSGEISIGKQPETKADVNDADEEGMTPLGAAVVQNFGEVVRDFAPI